MLVRLIFTIAAFCLATEAYADDATGSDWEPFTGFSERCPYRVIFAPRVQIGSAEKTKTGEPVIVLDPLLTRKGEEWRLKFFAAHECAHHVLGHTEAAEIRKRKRSLEVVRDQELSADCWAAEFLAEVENQDVVRVMAERFYRGGFYSPGAGYPGGLQRSLIVARCGYKNHDRPWMALKGHLD